MTMRCDQCCTELGRGVERYWHMRFCSSCCVSAYQRRLAEDTKLKIRRLDSAANDNFGFRFRNGIGRRAPA